MKSQFETRSETSVDEGCVEVLVTYRIEQEASQVEECHGYHELGNNTLVELTHVEVIIGGKSVDILKFLDKKQEDKLIDCLSIW